MMVKAKAPAAMLAEFQGWPGLALRPAGEGTWDVLSSGRDVGTWRRTDDGAVMDDCAGERVLVVTAFAGTGTAAIAGCGAHAGAWTDLAHKVLAGNYAS